MCGCVEQMPVVSNADCRDINQQPTRGTSPVIRLVEAKAFHLAENISLSMTAMVKISLHTTRLFTQGILLIQLKAGVQRRKRLSCLKEDTLNKIFRLSGYRLLAREHIPTQRYRNRSLMVILDTAPWPGMNSKSYG